MTKGYIVHVMLIIIIIWFAYCNSLHPNTSTENFAPFNKFYRPHVRTVGQFTGRVYNDLTHKALKFYNRFIK